MNKIWSLQPSCTLRIPVAIAAFVHVVNKTTVWLERQTRHHLVGRWKTSNYERSPDCGVFIDFWENQIIALTLNQGQKIQCS